MNFKFTSYNGLLNHCKEIHKPVLNFRGELYH